MFQAFKGDAVPVSDLMPTGHCDAGAVLPYVVATRGRAEGRRRSRGGCRRCCAAAVVSFSPLWVSRPAGIDPNVLSEPFQGPSGSSLHVVAGSFPVGTTFSRGIRAP